jgi:hypothetical protein
MSRISRLVSALVAATLIAAPAGAFAQDMPQAPAPSYAHPSYSSNEDVVRGQVVSFDGGYSLRVRDDRGYIDNVSLHQGTIINPTGLRLSPGMSVTVRGVNRGGYLDANQIDTPYTTYSAVPVYPYAVAVPVAPYYGYPYYGYPYGYGYYPRVSIGIGFGHGFGHGFVGHGGYGGHWR